MRYSLEGCDKNTLGPVEALRKQRMELVEQKIVVTKSLSSKGRQKEKQLKYKEQEELSHKLEAIEKRLEELTGIEKGRIFGPPSKPATQRNKAPQSNEWISVFEGGAPGLGKRS